MNQTVFNNLCLLCLIFGLSLNAKKECVECKKPETNKNMIETNDLDNQILQIIKTAFQNKKVKFEIPKKMESEFQAKKQAIIDNLNQKIKKAKTDKIYLPEITKLVNEAFDLFVERVKYAQLSEKINSILSNIKKDPNAPNSSSIFRDKSFITTLNE